MCDYPEFLEEGKFATLTALREVTAALAVQSQLLSELAEHGHYVPETLPTDQQPVVLLVIQFAYCGAGKELLQRPVQLDVYKASYTGFSVRDWDEGNIVDAWQNEAGEVFDVNCAEHCVFWVPMPEQWQPLVWNSWGAPFPAHRADVPVLKHLVFRDDATSPCLYVPADWSEKE